ncbi:hypothetical protein ACFYM2_21255 [Streptomyces sp. NPDC006711]|uniref:hypothetical protein n=1 Tax=Streptomyces sp. NPDC006711 TaxID=3364762 RepID=UPI0036CE2B94
MNDQPESCPCSALQALRARLVDERHGHHAYLSTGCLHGDHSYCQTQAKRYDGSTKTAATCKFCESADDRGGHCVCRCHREGS